MAVGMVVEAVVAEEAAGVPDTAVLAAMRMAMRAACPPAT